MYILTTASLRSALMRYLSLKGIPRDRVKSDLDKLDGDYSFYKMLTLFTGCISIRNMEGLVKNSINDFKYIENQVQIIKTAKDRLAQTPFFRTYPHFYHKFENMVMFRSENVYSLCSPGNQDYQIIVHF